MSVAPDMCNICR